jgi:hypothetical protein
VVTKPLEVIEVFGNFGQLEVALDAGLDVKVGLSLRGVGIGLFVGIDYPVMGDVKAVNVGGDSPVV